MLVMSFELLVKNFYKYKMNIKKRNLLGCIWFSNTSHLVANNGKRSQSSAQC